MKLTLSIPGLTWLDALDGAEAARDLPLPALETLLGRARLSRRPQRLSAHLAEPFGLERIAHAASCAAVDGLDTAGRYWLFADPVNLRIDRDRALLADVGVMRIDADEAAALIAALNAHFADDDWRFHAPTPGRWYVSLPAAPQIEATPLPDVIGENIDEHLPKGHAGLQLGRMLNEIQMLLFSHQVNEAREARGETRVNSVWLWGGGNAAVPAPLLPLYADPPLCREMARAGGFESDIAPHTFAAWLDLCDGRDGWVLLDRVLGAAQYRDVWGWREAVAELEQDWFAPLLQALRSGRIRHLTLLSHGDNGIRADIRRPDLFRFWRRGCALSSLY
jgi:hypothetical protein